MLMAGERSHAMKDRFTTATAELTEKNPYICTSCETTYGHTTVEHLGHEAGVADLGTRSAECILFCEPMPFGD